MLSPGFDQRRAVTKWRDDWLFRVWDSMGKATRRALDDLEADLPKAGARDVYISPHAFADPRVDRSMRLALGPFFDQIRALAAPTLRAIDPILTDVCIALRETDFRRFMPEQVASVPTTANSDVPLTAAGVSVGKSVIGSAATVAAGLIVGPEMAIVVGVGTIASVASPLFHQWLRDAGSKRLVQAWLGIGGDSAAVASKVAAVFDGVAEKAREVLH